MAMERPRVSILLGTENRNDICCSTRLVFGLVIKLRSALGRSAFVALVFYQLRCCLLGQGEGNDVVAAFVIKLGVATGSDHDVLLAAYRVGRRRSIDTRACLEVPEY